MRGNFVENSFKFPWDIVILEVWYIPHELNLFCLWIISPYLTTQQVLYTDKNRCRKSDETQLQSLAAQIDLAFI